ncbi:hypothetical protein IV84_GL000588 [Pediococcus damnosus]|nr:hypothetical protein IV84_GL000588 [Pediococcus damnosus]
MKENTMQSNNHNSDNNQPRRTQHSQLTSPPHRRRSIFIRILLWIVGIFVIVLIAGAGLFMYYAKDAPSISEKQLSSDEATVIYDKNGETISRLGAQDRDYVKADEIPKTLKSAVVSIEDKRFYKNNGVDPVRILGATFANVSGSSLGLQGASTLTQQLVKLSVFSIAAKDRTLRVKSQEAWLALQVDKKYSKDKILEFYINKVYMGNGVYGMGTAAKYYYGKSLSDLSLSQLALLAGMPQAPTSYDPNKYPDYALSRRNTVLQAMVNNNVITKSQANEASKTSIKSGLVKSPSIAGSSTVNSKVVDSYVKQVISSVEAKGFDPYTDGMKIYTNLDLDAQKQLYKIGNTNDYVQYPDSKFQLGASITNPNNGKVVAMLGGRQTGNVTYGLNRAVQTDRSSGSTAKPLMDYGPAIQYLNWPTSRKVKDEAFKYPGTNIKLYDFDRQYQGKITMRQALVQSRNIPAVRTLQDVGISKATNFLSNLGISQKSNYTLQNGIGLYISPLQESAAYAAFANGGTYYKPYYVNKIVTQSGKTYRYSSQGKRAMSKATAYMITDMLKGVMSSSTGSGTTANIPGLYQAGKTGTTAYPSDIASNYPSTASMDAWFTGYTRHYSMSVWTGYDQQNTASGFLSQQETLISQSIYKSMMSYLSSSVTNENWVKPSSVTERTVDGVKELFKTNSTYDTSGTSDDYSTNNSTSVSSSSRTASTPAATSSDTSAKSSSNSNSSNSSSNNSSTSSSSSSSSASSSSSSSSSSSTKSSSSSKN